MKDELNIWKKIDEMPGGGRDPFTTPVGPTKECLSSNQVVSFVENGETDLGIIEHLNRCKACHERVERLKAVR